MEVNSGTKGRKFWKNLWGKKGFEFLGISNVYILRVKQVRGGGMKSLSYKVGKKGIMYLEKITKEYFSSQISQGK